MPKALKIIILGAITVVVLYIAYFVHGVLRYKHSSNWEMYKQYMWIFKDSVKKDIDTNFCYSYVKKRDIYNNFHYKRINNIIVWEFKDLNSTKLKDISFNQNVNLNGVKFSSGEILNKKSDLEITIKFGFDFNYKMNVNLDSYSKIERSFEASKYKGFYGTINEMSFSNEKGEHQILLHYTKGLTPTLFLLYKGHQSFYIIIINSDQPFDEHIINILNLS